MSNQFDSWVTVVPGKGRVAEVARALLDLAPDPADVRTQSNGDEFLIPPDLADAYHALTKPKPARRRTKEGN